MMSLNKMSLGEIVKKQFQYKLKAYASVFSSLVVLQIIAILFSLGGNGSSGSYNNNLSINTTLYTNTSVLILTMLWIVIHAIMITTKAERENGFTFVSNQLSNNLSNALFLLLASVLGGITTILASFLLRVIVYFFIDTNPIIGTGFTYQLSDVLIGIVAMIFYLILLGSFGYLLGMITQLHRMLPVIVPVLVIGMIITIAQTESDVIIRFSEFYYQETNALFFILKILVTSILCFIGAILVSHRLEARR